MQDQKIVEDIVTLMCESHLHEIFFAEFGLVNKAEFILFNFFTERQLAEGEDVVSVPFGDGGGGGDGSSGHSDDSDLDGDGGVPIRGLFLAYIHYLVDPMVEGQNTVDFKIHLDIL